jgi:hypothetical protein
MTLLNELLNRVAEATPDTPVARASTLTWARC